MFTLVCSSNYDQVFHVHLSVNDCICPGTMYFSQNSCYDKTSRCIYLFYLFIYFQYFETDDPELYKSKICYIEENDINDMELFFCEEEYTGQSAKV